MTAHDDRHDIRARLYVLETSVAAVRRPPEPDPNLARELVAARLDALRQALEARRTPR